MIVIFLHSDLAVDSAIEIWDHEIYSPWKKPPYGIQYVSLSSIVIIAKLGYHQREYGINLYTPKGAVWSTFNDYETMKVVSLVLSSSVSISIFFY